MTKWGNCVLEGVYGGAHANYPGLYPMTVNGTEVITNFKDRPKNVSESQAVAQMIFQLGEDGWELTFGQYIGDLSSVNSRDYMWFKRPKP